MKSSALNKTKFTFYLGARMSGTSFNLGLMLFIACSFGLLSMNDFKAVYAIGILISVVAMLNIQGATIDMKRNRAFSFQHFLIFKYKQILVPYDKFEKIVLVPFRDNETMRMYSIESTVKTRTFDIYLITPENEKILIKEFTEYKKGAVFLENYSQLFNLTKEDRLDEFKRKSKRNRRKGVTFQ